MREKEQLMQMAPAMVAMRVVKREPN